MSRNPPDAVPPRRDDRKPVRIAKAIARAGLTSRRDAEAWIAQGRVAVNGETITTPAVTVTARDRVTVDGAPLPQRERTRLFLYYKPVGLVTTNADPEGRPTIFAALPRSLPRLISIGRLDIATEGLLLLTNDGGLARVLELPATGWVRRYRVRAHGHVEPAALARLRDGITIDGIHYGPIEATLDREQGANVWLTVAIREGKNREVRNVVDALGLQANRLIRLSFGPFQLGDMSEGEVVEVKTRVLRDQLGERIAEEAGCDFSAPVIEREAEAEARRPPRAERIARGGRASAERPPRRPSNVRPDRERRENPLRGEHARPRDDREGRPRGRDDREGPARARRRDRDEQPPRQDERRRRPRRSDRDRPDRELADKPAGRPRRGHAWRSDDAPLGRHYRGAGSKAREIPDDAARPKRAGLIADRKGRRVLVERFGEKAVVSRKAGGPLRVAGNTPLLNPPPQGGRERSRTNQQPRSKPDRRGSKSERRENEQPRRRPFSTSPLEGESLPSGSDPRVGAKRREGGKFKARSGKGTPLPNPPPQGGRERFSAASRHSDTSSRGGGKPGGHGKTNRGGRPGPRDRPRGAGPRPSRPPRPGPTRE